MRITTLKSIALAVLCLVSLGATAVHAEQNIDDDKLKAAMEKAHKERDRAAYLLSPEFNAKSLPSPGINLENLPKANPGLPSINTSQISKAWELLSNKADEPKVKVKVFISFSMNDESLKRIIDQADLIGREQISLSLIGLKELSNWQLTLSKISDLTAGKDVVIEVDPNGFEKYGISQVPAIVLYRDDPVEEARCAIEGDKEKLKHLQSYIGVYGDVSIEYALDHLLKTEFDWKNEISLLLEKVTPSLSSYKASTQ